VTTTRIAREFVWKSATEVLASRGVAGRPMGGRFAAGSRRAAYVVVSVTTAARSRFCFSDRANDDDLRGDGKVTSAAFPVQ
jgi:hypothetical protein